MHAKKIISGIITSMLLMNTAIAATSSSYKIDVDSLNGGGNFGSSSNYKLNDTIVGFVNGQFGNSTSYILGSGLVYLELLCGNGIKEFGETCDDGNTTSGDGCNSTCQTETTPPSAVCGNSSVESGEQCDDGNIANGDGCSSSCTTESGGGGGGGYSTPYSYHTCGNGIKEFGETCDDGNTISGDGCSNVCSNENLLPSAPDCGNGIKENGEQCDDGNNKSGDGCSDICQNENVFQLAVCGNGAKETGEECDDGNKVNNDSCSSQCRLTEKGKAEQETPVREIRIIAHPEKRVNATENWATTGRVTFYNLTLRKIALVTNVDMNDVGWSVIKTDKLPEGDYLIAFKGRSHLTKIIKQIRIDKEIQTIDFSFSGESYLVAGDVHESKDDFIDGLDIAATVKNLYTTDIDADLNHDGIVNSLDISIVVSNIYRTGEKIQI